MEIIEDRHGKRSTLFTSPMPVSKWYEVVGEQSHRRCSFGPYHSHYAHRLDLTGESLRKRRLNLTLETTQPLRSCIVSPPPKLRAILTYVPLQLVAVTLTRKEMVSLCGVSRKAQSPVVGAVAYGLYLRRLVHFNEAPRFIAHAHIIDTRWQ